jgi:hypothetical protein
VYPEKLRVMAEYASSGIWVVKSVGPFRHVMVEYDSLKLPKDLAQRFERWIRKYEFPKGAQAEAGIQEFNKEGRVLAVELKKHVGEGTRVFYVPEKGDGSIGEEEEIESW